MKIYFIRHGKDDSNYRGGWSNLKLIPQGVQQALYLAHFLSKHKQEHTISKIISSDLKRAVQTAQIIQKELKCPLVLSKD